MSLVHQYDIRLESYSNNDPVTSLTDQVGTDDLGSIAGVGSPIYNSANDWIVFTDDAIGDATMPASWETIFQSDNWLIAVLFEQATLGGDFIFGIGDSAAASPGIGIRTDGSGNGLSFLRGDDATTDTATTSGGISTDTPTVIIMRRDSTNVYVSIDAGTEASTAVTTDIDTSDWNRVAIGLLPRSTYGNSWDGNIQEVRVYDSNESGNLSAIVSSMKSGVTVPVLSSPLGSATGQTTAQGEVTTDTGNGTLYGIMSTSATKPSIAQIQAGQDHTGSAAPWDDSQSVVTSGNQVMSATGLTAATNYFFHAQQEDSGTNDSLVASSIQFTTDTLPTPDITNITTPVITGGAVTTTGTDFESPQGTGNTTQEGTSLTETAWSDTSVTSTSLVIESTTERYGLNTLMLTNDSGNSDSTMFEATPLAGNDFVDLEAPLATSGDRITAIADLVGGDQLRHEAFLQQGVVTTAFTVDIDTAGVFIIGNGPVPDGTYEFEVRANDGTGWGTAADQTVTFSGGGIVSEEKELLIRNMVSNFIQNLIN